LDFGSGKKSGICVEASHADIVRRCAVILCKQLRRGGWLRHGGLGIVVSHA